MKTFLTFLAGALTATVVTLGVVHYQNEQQPQEDYRAAQTRRIQIEAAEVNCEARFVGQMSDRESKAYCHSQLQREWDEWAHAFPNAARERALVQQ